ncbi:MAG: hypothetical protein K1V99_08310 [Bacteroidales bacterium]|nr:hypothetical protein [Bacteroidales bacterium]
MNWKSKLRQLIDGERWEDALKFMDEVLESDSHSADSYLNYSYLLGEILMEAEFGTPLLDYCEIKIYQVYKEAMARYSDDVDFLFWQSFLITRCDYFYNMDIYDAEEMMYKAYLAKPDDKLYQWARLTVNNGDMDDEDETRHRGKIKKYIRAMFADEALLKRINEKGPVGEYWLYLCASSLEKSEYNEICRAHLLPACYC